MKKRYLIPLVILVALILYVVFSGLSRDLFNTLRLKRYWQKNYSMVPPKSQNPEFSFKRVAKAQKDGCFFSVGNENNQYAAKGIDIEACLAEGGNPKANQSYIWCSTEEAGKLFYGTASNYLCQSFMNFSRNDSLHDNCLACEWKYSMFGAQNDLIGFYGDFRPPHAYVFDPETGEHIDITPYEDPLLQHTLGLRAAGSIDSIVFFAGPGMGKNPGELQGIRIFAFDAITNDFLESVQLDSLLAEYHLQPDNVRRCACVNESLYIGLSAKDLKEENKKIGIVLKWTGNRHDLFKCQLVARVPGPVNEITLHNDRLYLHTWPTINMGHANSDEVKIESVSSIYMSSKIEACGLTEDHIDSWEKVWDYSKYDPDDFVWQAYSGGKMISYNGYLYYGTLHMPMANFLMMKLKKDDASTWEMLNGLLGSHRAITVFRCKDFSLKEPEVEIVFGMEELPVYDTEKKKWKTEANKLNKKPLSGPMGIWSPFNHYTWSMEELDGKLFIGTKSFFRMVPEMVSAMSDKMVSRLQKRIDTTKCIRSEIINVSGLYIPSNWVGGDLFYLTKDSNIPLNITSDGFGNQYNYGMRSMTRIRDKLYVGTANPYNLTEKGGYELIEVR